MLMKIISKISLLNLPLKFGCLETCTYIKWYDKLFSINFAVRQSLLLVNLIIILKTGYEYENTQRIITWINEEPDNSFINPGYSPVFSDEHIQLGNKELMQICAHCLSVPRFPLFFKCGHLTCLPCLNKYYKLNFNYNFKV